MWFGAVSTLLALIHTLGAFAEPIEAIGGMIGASLVGVMLGLLMAVGLLHPLTNRLEAVITDDANFYAFIRTAFLCQRACGDAVLAVRTACGALPPDLALSPADLEALAQMSAVRAA